MATETKNQFGEFLKGLFWIFLLFLVFGVLAFFPASVGTIAGIVLSVIGGVAVVLTVLG